MTTIEQKEKRDDASSPAEKVVGDAWGKALECDALECDVNNILARSQHLRAIQGRLTLLERNLGIKGRVDHSTICEDHSGE
jgi:hypothetical protein